MRVVPRDTDVTPYDMGTLGSRSLFHMGHAVRRAAEDARDKLKALAREVGEPEGSNIPSPICSRSVTACRPATSIGTGIYKPDYVRPPRTGLSAQRHAVLDGRRRRRRGRGRHRDRPRQDHQARQRRRLRQGHQPESVETQISGAALMHLGFTMFEKMHIDGGQVTNASLADYKIPGFHDLPADMENTVDTIIERPVRRQGRRRGRDLLRVAGIANAIDDAVGVRLTELPLNPEAVLSRAPRQGRQAAGRRVNDRGTHHHFHAQRRAGHGRRQAAP